VYTFCSCWRSRVDFDAVLYLALFMLRDPSFVDDVPEEHRKDFVDSSKIAPCKLKILKKMIHDRFPVRAVYPAGSFISLLLRGGRPVILPSPICWHSKKIAECCSNFYYYYTGGMVRPPVLWYCWFHDRTAYKKLSAGSLVVMSQMDPLTSYSCSYHNSRLQHLLQQHNPEWFNSLVPAYVKLKVAHLI